MLRPYVIHSLTYLIKNELYGRLYKTQWRKSTTLRHSRKVYKYDIGVVIGYKILNLCFSSQRSLTL